MHAITTQSHPCRSQSRTFWGGKEWRGWGALVVTCSRGRAVGRASPFYVRHLEFVCTSVDRSINLTCVCVRVFSVCLTCRGEGLMLFRRILASFLSIFTARSCFPHQPFPGRQRQTDRQTETRPTDRERHDRQPRPSKTTTTTTAIGIESKAKLSEDQAGAGREGEHARWISHTSASPTTTAQRQQMVPNASLVRQIKHTGPGLKNSPTNRPTRRFTHMYKRNKTLL